MKKIFIFFSVLVLMFCFALTASAANSITSRLKGRLLLQVQDKGRIWYVDPVGLQKHEVTFANALSLFQKLALGITNTDLIKIPADLDSMNPNLDSDNDGYPDKEELQNGYSPYIPGSNKGRFKTDNNLATKLKGRLLLQVQDRGRIWYIDLNGKRWEVTWGNLMSLFRKLALGITDKDLETVGNIKTVNWRTYKNEEYGYEVRYPDKYFLNDSSTAESVIFDTEGPGAGLMIEIIDKSYPNRVEELANMEWESTGNKEVNKIIWNMLHKQGTTSVPGTWYKSIRQLSPEDKVIEITLNRSTEELFNQILSTFKFLD